MLLRLVGAQGPLALLRCSTATPAEPERALFLFCSSSPIAVLIISKRIPGEAQLDQIGAVELVTIGRNREDAVADPNVDVLLGLLRGRVVIALWRNG